MDDKIQSAVDAVRLYGSIKAASRATGISNKTLAKRIGLAGYTVADIADHYVVGRNAGMLRHLPGGKVINIAKPVSAQIDIETIARGMARIGFECGQTDHYVSLAAVCSRFSQWVAKETRSIDLAMMAILRYAHCAYVGYVPDVVMKNVTGNLPRFQESVIEAIYDHFDILFAYSVHKKELDELFSRFMDTVWDYQGGSPRLDEPEYIKNFTSLISVRKSAKED